MFQIFNVWAMGLDASTKTGFQMWFFLKALPNSFEGIPLPLTPTFNPGGHWPTKRVWGCAALKTPFHASPVVRKGPISSKRVSSQDPLLRKFGNFSLYSLTFCLNFRSQAPKFGNFQFTRTLFQRQISVRKPHTSDTSAHPYLKKRWVPSHMEYILKLPLILTLTSTLI